MALGGEYRARLGSHCVQWPWMSVEMKDVVCGELLTSGLWNYVFRSQDLPVVLRRNYSVEH